MTEEISERRAYLFKTLCFNVGLEKFDTKGFPITNLPDISTDSLPNDAATKGYVDKELTSTTDKINQQISLITQPKLTHYKEVIVEFSAKRTALGFAAPSRLTDICSHSYIEGGLYSSFNFITVSTRFNLMTANKELHNSENNFKKDLLSPIKIKIRGSRHSTYLLEYEAKRVSSRYRSEKPIPLEHNFPEKIELHPYNFDKIFSKTPHTSVRTIQENADSIRMILVFVLEVGYKFNNPNKDDET